MEGFEEAGSDPAITRHVFRVPRPFSCANLQFIADMCNKKSIFLKKNRPCYSMSYKDDGSSTPADGRHTLQHLDTDEGR